MKSMFTYTKSRTSPSNTNLSTRLPMAPAIIIVSATFKKTNLSGTKRKQTTITASRIIATVMSSAVLPAMNENAAPSLRCPASTQIKPGMTVKFQF